MKYLSFLALLAAICVAACKKDEARQPDTSYRQEYYFNNAEDEAKVLEVGKTLVIPFGTFENCIKIEEWTDLEPDQIGYKIYAPGIGIIQDNDEIFLKEIQ